MEHTKADPGEQGPGKSPCRQQLSIFLTHYYGHAPCLSCCNDELLLNNSPGKCLNYKTQQAVMAHDRMH
jgi:hypothetical protein